MALIGLTTSFVVALALMTVWCLIFAMTSPLRQAFINGLIPSQQRATVLSFDALIGSSGGVIAQPALGRTADVYGYRTSYVVAAAIQALAIPFAILARRENASSDPITSEAEPNGRDGERRNRQSARRMLRRIVGVTSARCCWRPAHPPRFRRSRT